MKPCADTTLSKVIFKLDTGADLTTISKKELHLLGYSKEWIKENAVKEEHHTLTSAGGRSATAHYVRIPMSNILGRDLKNWPFYIRIEDDRDFPNLLGINVLLHFNFTYNYGQGALLVEPEENPAIKLPMISGQEIGEIVSTSQNPS
jgi:hypothetical protein